MSQVQFPIFLATRIGGNTVTKVVNEDTYIQVCAFRENNSTYHFYQVRKQVPDEVRVLLTDLSFKVTDEITFNSLRMEFFKFVQSLHQKFDPRAGK